MIDDHPMGESGGLDATLNNFWITQTCIWVDLLMVNQTI